MTSPDAGHTSSGGASPTTHGRRHQSEFGRQALRAWRPNSTLVVLRGQLSNLNALVRAIDCSLAVVAADVPAAQAAVMAAAQRPATLLSLGTPSGPPAWKTVPSWYLVTHDDMAIPPAAERYMAKRAGARTFEIRSSHAAMVSHPETVIALVLSAARTTS